MIYKGSGSVTEDQIKEAILDAMRPEYPDGHMIVGIVTYRELTATRIPGQAIDYSNGYHVKPISECADYVRSIVHLL